MLGVPGAKGRGRLVTRSSWPGQWWWSQSTPSTLAIEVSASLCFVNFRYKWLQNVLGEGTSRGAQERSKQPARGRRWGTAGRHQADLGSSVKGHIKPFRFLSSLRSTPSQSELLNIDVFLSLCAWNVLQLFQIMCCFAFFWQTVSLLITPLKLPSLILA